MNSNFSYKKAGVDLDKSDLIKDKLLIMLPLLIIKML